MQLKSREVSVHIAYFGFEILHRARRYHCRALCNIWRLFNNNTDIMGEQNFARTEFNSLVVGDFNEILDSYKNILWNFPQMNVIGP